MNETYIQLLKQANQAVAEAAATLGDDSHRPIYHILPQANWLNDPNGPVYHAGYYHMFFQHNPYQADFGLMGWGHVRSRDLVYWEHRPIAIMPTPQSYDSAGIWSGSIVVHNGTPTMMYSGVAKLNLYSRDDDLPPSDKQRIPQGYYHEFILEIEREVQCIATSSDGLESWEKHPANPVIGATPPGLDLIGFRDPYLWREEDGYWYVLLGTGIKGQGGAALLYRSPDLIAWDYLHPLYIGQPAESGLNWECPNFLNLGRQHMLVVSPHGRPIYWLGDYREHRFTPAGPPTRLDWGDAFYAPNSLRDPSGRWLMWGWVREARSRDQYVAAGWSSCLTLPREIALDADNSLTVKPAAELQALRSACLFDRELTIADGRSTDLSGISGAHLEISCRVTQANCQKIGLQFRRSPDGAQLTELSYDFESSLLRLSRDRSTGTPEVTLDPCECHLVLAGHESLDLTIFLDGSVIEIYANNRRCITSRIYPNRTDALGLNFFADGGEATAHLKIWKMGSIWGKNTA
ncbi:MAG: glycoside hydrolase family 32 protein [Anaerolineae bacterium]